MLLIAAISVAVLLQLAPHHAAQEYYSVPGPPGYQPQASASPHLTPIQRAAEFVPRHDPLYGAASASERRYFGPELLSPYDAVPHSEYQALSEAYLHDHPSFYSPLVNQELYPFQQPLYTFAEYEIVPNPYDIPVPPYYPSPYDIPVPPYSPIPYDIPVSPYSTDPYDVSVYPYSPYPYDISVSPYSPYPYDIPVSPYSTNPYDVSVYPYSPYPYDISVSPYSPYPYDIPGSPYSPDLQAVGSYGEDIYDSPPEVYTGMGGDAYQDSLDKLITIDANLDYNNPDFQESPGITRDEIVYNSLMSAFSETPENEIQTTMEGNHYGESGWNNSPSAEYHDSESMHFQDDEEYDISSTEPSYLPWRNKKKTHPHFSGYIQRVIKKAKEKFRDPKELVSIFLKLEKRIRKLEEIGNVNSVDKLNETNSSEEDIEDYPTRGNSSRAHHHDASDHNSDYEQNYDDEENVQSDEYGKVSEARKALDSSSDVHTEDKEKKVVDIRLKSLSPFPKPAVTSIGFGLARNKFIFDGQAQRSYSGKLREPINISRLFKHYGKADETKTNLNNSLQSGEESGHDDEHRANKKRRNINYPPLTFNPLHTEYEKKPEPKGEISHGSGSTRSVNVIDSPLYYYKCCMAARNALMGNSSSEEGSRKKRSISDHTASSQARLLQRPMHNRATAYLSNPWYSRLASKGQNITWMPRLGIYSRMKVDDSSLQFLNHNSYQQDSPTEKVKPLKRSRKKSSPKRKSQRRPATKKGSGGRPKPTSEEALTITLPPAAGSAVRY